MYKCLALFLYKKASSFSRPCALMFQTDFCVLIFEFFSPLLSNPVSPNSHYVYRVGFAGHQKMAVATVCMKATVLSIPCQSRGMSWTAL